MTDYADIVKRLTFSAMVKGKALDAAYLDNQAADAITQLQRDNAALMEDAAAQIQIAREATERAAGLEQPTLEMIQAGLAVRWTALYRDCLYGEHDGIHLRAETETRINMMRQQYLAMVGAAVSHKED